MLLFLWKRSNRFEKVLSKFEKIDTQSFENERPIGDL